MNTSVKWGFIGGVGLSASFTTLLATAGQSSAQMQLVYLALGLVVLAFTLFAGLRARKQQGDFASEKGIREGLVITMIASFILAGFLYVYLKWINPEVIANYVHLLSQGIEEAKLTDNEKQAQLENIKALNSPFQIIKYFLPRVILGGATFTIVSTFLLQKLKL